ncbi:Ppx/GppA phosphatase family protein [Klugiella xanthotipulae]|uniref:Exopolyphosphatase/guanosine-5'-triphosphate, 3'-diphosphate pyrophosphatase n=1 Tax=Klugiella xanthotipulae TaxID=244735 RepID=A0A543I5C4_9MICO|nr:exopolyphosphatase [Klugiella xanthotipulae]TQM65789.1 exopolyphosphatase/guanosine-5'-triphosphate,3'-diphosphate pyrophosphatase [Klugiella xanthotipulae]
MTTVAAIDCGTNSIRLLISTVTPASASDGLPQLTDIVRESRVVRLGYGVDRTGEFHPDALARTVEATEDYARLIAAHDCQRVRFVATSATRDARNRETFIAGVVAALGVEPEVISGEQEAQLSFVGAISGAARDQPGPYLVADLGGGSTELVLGTDRVTAAHSMDIGSVRLTERHLGITDTALRRTSIRADIEAAIDRAEALVHLGQARTLIGVAGTVTTVAAHALRLPAYDSKALDGCVIDVDATLAACHDLETLDRGSLAALPYVHPGRIDIIGTGALIWADVIERVRARVAAQGGELNTVMTSEHDILDGIALSLAE